MDESNLRNLRTAFSGGLPELEDLLQQVEQKLESLDSMYAEIEVQLENPQVSWRIQVKLVVQAIVEPDEILWMDDDESLSDMQYINRALSEVENRFDR